MKKNNRFWIPVVVVVVIVLLAVCIYAFGGSKKTSQSNQVSQSGQTDKESTTAQQKTTVAGGNNSSSTANSNTASQDKKKSLVVYFNYSDNIDTTGMSVDAVSSASLHSNANGNTENLKLMAQEIADKKNADIFVIKINELYPADFNDMAPIAREDIQKGTKFTFKELPSNLDQYDTVYVGSPIWWYELPQPMKVFISQVNLSNKTVVPFGIHRGSGFNGILDEYRKAWPGANVVDGFTISADEKNSAVKKSFDEFLDGLKF